jgi:hypothetical protein
LPPPPPVLPKIVLPPPPPFKVKKEIRAYPAESMGPSTSRRRRISKEIIDSDSENEESVPAVKKQKTVPVVDDVETISSSDDQNGTMMYFVSGSVFPAIQG